MPLVDQLTSSQYYLAQNPETQVKLFDTFNSFTPEDQAEMIRALDDYKDYDAKVEEILDKVEGDLGKELEESMTSLKKQEGEIMKKEESEEHNKELTEADSLLDEL